VNKIKRNNFFVGSHINFLVKLNVKSFYLLFWSLSIDPLLSMKNNAAKASLKYNFFLFLSNECKFFSSLGKWVSRATEARLQLKKCHRGTTLGEREVKKKLNWNRAMLARLQCKKNELKSCQRGTISVEKNNLHWLQFIFLHWSRTNVARLKFNFLH